MKEFDENEAVAFIKSQVPEACQYSDDDVVLLIDTMMDYYGALDDDAPDEQWDTPAVTEFVTKQLKRDKLCHIRAEHVQAMVQAELDYEDTLQTDDDD